MKKPSGLAGKTVVVTGGAGKLGRRLVPFLLKEGARIAVLDTTVSFRTQAPKGILSIRTDVTSRSSLEAALSVVIKRLGAPYGLVNAAAIDSPPDASSEINGPFENYPESQWNRVLDVNTKGVFLACQVFGGAMARAGKGAIVNISSIYGIVSPDQRIYAYRAKNGRKFFKPASYSVSKSALINLTRYLATYWGRSRVRVNTLTLGGIFDGQDASFLKAYQSRVPMGRMARPGECNAAIRFLLSEESSYMTGSNLVMDGGWTAW